MDCIQVLRRLCEIERAIGVSDSNSVREMVMEVQDFILQSQKDSVSAARLNSSRIALSGEPGS